MLLRKVGGELLKGFSGHGFGSCARRKRERRVFDLRSGLNLSGRFAEHLHGVARGRIMSDAECDVEAFVAAHSPDDDPEAGAGNPRVRLRKLRRVSSNRSIRLNLPWPTRSIRIVPVIGLERDARRWTLLVFSATPCSTSAIPRAEENAMPPRAAPVTESPGHFVAANRSSTSVILRRNIGRLTPSRARKENEHR